MDDTTPDAPSETARLPVPINTYRFRRAKEAPPPSDAAAPPSPESAADARRVLVLTIADHLEIAVQHAQAICSRSAEERPTPEATLAARCVAEVAAVAPLLSTLLRLA